MLCGSRSQIYAHKYWFSSRFFSSVQPFIYPAKRRPWVWEKQLADCGSMQGIVTRFSPHNLDLFIFRCYLSDSRTLLQNIIPLCVGCIWRFVFLYANTSFSTGHLTHFSVWIRSGQSPAGRMTNAGKKIKDNIQPVTRQNPNFACQQSKAGRDRSETGVRKG